jgi:hypothetical protein
MPRNLRRQIFELRYAPTHNFFDHRSALLDTLYSDRQTRQKNFEHWQLTDNRVDVFDTDKKRTFFVSFHNCGFSCDDPPSNNYAKDQLVKYVRLAFGVIGEYVEEIRRVGFRETQVLAVRDIETLRESLLNRFIRTDDGLFGGINATVSDLQLFPIVFKQGQNNFQITMGPTDKAQLETQLWGSDPQLPEKALYVDIDYYSVKPFVDRTPDRHITEFVTNAQDTQGRILQELSALAEGEE